MKIPLFVSERTLTSLVLLITGVALYVSSLDSRYADLGGAQDPNFFPHIILAFWIGLSAISLIAEILKPQPLKPVLVLRLASLCGLFLIYVLMIMQYGFLMCSVVFCFLVLLLLEVRRPITLIGFSIMLPGSLLLLFNHVLSLPLPTSPFSHLF